ncbi:MAG TPA: DUF2336 domain-containing protein [Xanthobacteraceae bacterium]|jgi:uncharacterized protein (DUF2336 family)
MVLSSAIPELENVLQHGSPERLHLALRGVTTLFVEGASRFNDSHVRLFEGVLGTILDRVDTRSRAELSQRLAPISNAPAEIVRRLARDTDISVAGPVLERSPQLPDAELVEIARTGSDAHRRAISRRKARGETPVQLAQLIAASGPRDDTAAGCATEGPREKRKLNQAILIELARSGRHEEMVTMVAEICAVPGEAVARLMAGERPDPVLVLCKSAGFEWPAAEALIRACPRMGTSTIESARSNFERLSAATADRVMRFWRYRRTEDRRQKTE